MGVSLSDLLEALERLAPLRFAEDWDNAGLLIDPRAPGEELDVERALLTIDATPSVLQEARSWGAQCLVAYHPPLFQPAKRFRRASDVTLFEAISAGFAVYSPHTALDSAPNGLNDWLASAFPAGEVVPLGVAERADSNAELKLVVFVPEQNADALRDAMSEAGAGVIGNYSHCSFNLIGEGTFFGMEGTNPAVGNAGKLERAREVRIEMVCSKGKLADVARALVRHHPYEEPAWDVVPLAAKPAVSAGTGRLLTLESPEPLDALLPALKKHLGVSYLRVAKTPDHARGAPIRRVAVAAGSGASVLASARADLLVTGELGHHHVLGALRAGSSVVLCEHSSSERGYLPELRKRILDAVQDRLDVRVATSDIEPLTLA